MKLGLIWFRQDLRIEDNPTVSDAFNQCTKVIPYIIFEDQLSILVRAQGWWLHHSLPLFKIKFK